MFRLLNFLFIQRKYIPHCLSTLLMTQLTMMLLYYYSPINLLFIHNLRKQFLSCALCYFKYYCAQNKQTLHTKFQSKSHTNNASYSTDQLTYFSSSISHTYSCSNVAYVMFDCSFLMLSTYS